MPPPRPLQAVTAVKIPLFLAPALADLSVASLPAVRSFSSTTRNLKYGKGKDKNKRRGVSAMRSTGFPHRLTVDNHYKNGLPTPRPESERPLDGFPTNPNHGLYGFFNEAKQTVEPGEKEEDHGRSWTYHELLFKSFDDLHTVYWQCLLEQNRVATRQLEHQRLKLGYGRTEIEFRLATVRRSMSMVRKVLRDRQTAYEQARLLRETKMIKELLEAPEPVYESPDPEIRAALSTASVEPPVPSDMPGSQTQLATQEEKRRKLLGPRPED